MTDYLYAGRKGIYHVELAQVDGLVRAEASGPFAEGQDASAQGSFGPVARVVERTEEEAERALSSELLKLGA